jgi:glyoxylase-like metal-dependent hydrolase (beta-lactamase superfamily II)/rhodanese-related sulfurtransferase
LVASGFVLFRQLIDEDLGCASYLVGDEAAGVAVAVDPPYAIEPLLAAADAAGVRIVRVLETHTHADHLSGHGRLALEHGVPTSIHALAGPEYPFEPLEDGAAIRVGSVELRVVHTPGHRPEHCSFLVSGVAGGGSAGAEAGAGVGSTEPPKSAGGGSAGAEAGAGVGSTEPPKSAGGGSAGAEAGAGVGSTEPPKSAGGGSAGAEAGAAELVLTGDSLFVGDAARPDLAVGAAEGAEGLFHSLRRLAELPDPVSVYPGHVAGSLCGRAMSAQPSSTIGAERRSNPMLAIGELGRFVAESASVTAPRPPTVERCVALNRGPFVGAAPPLPRVAVPGGVVVLDVRDAHAFAAGHLPRALSVPVAGSSFATKAAFVLPGGPVLLHADSPEQAELAARRLRAIGLLDEPAGYLVDPAGATETLEPVAVSELDDLGATIVDVREPAEFAEGSIPGAVNIPYREAAAARLEGPVVTVCESGARAAVAASVLVRNGVDARAVIDGGVTGYRRRSAG